MSKKTSCLWRRNLSHLTCKPICQTLKTQQLPQIQRTEPNVKTKFYKQTHQTTNTNKRCATSRDKFKGQNCMPNNRTEQKPTIAKNVNRTLHFNANPLWHHDSEQATYKKPFPECKLYINDSRSQQHENHNLYKNCKCSNKLVNLPNTQRQQYRLLRQNYSLQSCQKILAKNYTHKCLNIAFEEICSKKHGHDVGSALNRNYCQHWDLCNSESKSKLLQFNKVMPRISASSKQLAKCHNQRRHDCQLTCFPQVSQHQEILLGLFEVLPPPLFPLKSSTCEIVKPLAEAKYELQNHFDRSKITKHQSPANRVHTNTKRVHSLPQRRHINDNDCDGFLKFLQKKSKPSDRDVIFGNAHLLLNKHYGWETSRIEWLLKLEQEHYLNDTNTKVNCI